MKLFIDSRVQDHKTFTSLCVYKRNGIPELGDNLGETCMQKFQNAMIFYQDIIRTVNNTAGFK